MWEEETKNTETSNQWPDVLEPKTKNSFFKNLRDKKFILWLAFALIIALFYLLRYEYQALFIFNNIILLFILHLIIIFAVLGVLLYKQRITGKWSTYSSVVVAGVFFIVLFFLFQDSKMQADKFNSILLTSNYNCQHADQIISNFANQDDIAKRIILNDYITEAYKDNLSFIYKIFTEEGGNKIMEAVRVMEKMSSLINITQGLSNQRVDESALPAVEKLLGAYNTVISNNSQIIRGLLKEANADYEGICD